MLTGQKNKLDKLEAVDLALLAEVNNITDRPNFRYTGHKALSVRGGDLVQ